MGAFSEASRRNTGAHTLSLDFWPSAQREEKKKCVGLCGSELMEFVTAELENEHKCCQRKFIETDFPCGLMVGDCTGKTIVTE